MAAPLQDFAKIMRFLFRFLRYASLIIVGVTALVIGREVAGTFGYLAEIHPVLGWAFLLVFFAAVGWFVGRPVMRFWRVPMALKQPRMPGQSDQLDRNQVATRLVFVARYLRGLQKNPELEARQRSAAVEAAERCDGLRRRVLSGEEGDAAACREAMTRFEAEVVQPMLAPLDEKANQIIRAEALAVGLATAVSWNGSIDAIIVLWRNANLVARVASIYYGRPGVRGSLMILRDTATAMFIASQMQGLVESAGGLFGKWFGTAGSVLAGPAVDGGINGITTLRIGYVAKARCRAFRPWNEANMVHYVKSAMKEVGSQGAGVVKDIVGAAIKSGIAKVPAELAKKTGNLLGGIIGRKQPSAG